MGIATRDETFPALREIRRIIDKNRVSGAGLALIRSYRLSRSRFRGSG